MFLSPVGIGRILATYKSKIVCRYKYNIHPVTNFSVKILLFTKAEIIFKRSGLSCQVGKQIIPQPGLSTSLTNITEIG